MDCFHVDIHLQDMYIPDGTNPEISELKRFHVGFPLT